MRRRCTLRRAALAFLVHGAAAQDPLAGFGGGDAYGAPPPQPMAPGPGGPPGPGQARAGPGPTAAAFGRGRKLPLRGTTGEMLFSENDPEKNDMFY